MKQIAIDGPSGAGKSTIAKKLSQELGFVYIDTGAMYRTLALFCLQQKAVLQDEAQVTALCEKAAIELRYIDGAQHTFLNGCDVSDAIRTEEVSAAASVISQYLNVRQQLLLQQRQLASRFDVVMDGRDIGTAVLPNAGLKVYLTASVEVRAQRRFEEYTEKGIACSLEKIKQDIEARDKSDMTREHSPLKKAEDAVVIDSSFLSVEQVVAAIKELL